MSIYQMAIIVLFALNIFNNLTRHGQDKNEKYNFWVAIVNTFIWVLILKGGGFF